MAQYKTVFFLKGNPVIQEPTNGVTMQESNERNESV